jgi:hypothetical protein
MAKQQVPFPTGSAFTELKENVTTIENNIFTL